MAETQGEHDKQKKLTVTVLTLSGEYTHKYASDILISEVIQEAIKHLKLVVNATWQVQHNGQAVDQTLTLQAAGVQDNDSLEFLPQEGGGGSLC